MSKKESQESQDEGNTILRPNRSRRWCFTLHNYNENDLETIISQSQCFRYVVGKELGKSGCKPHLQGYLEFKNQKCFGVLRSINKEIHWEMAKGSQSDNMRYCSKEGEFVTNFEQLKIRKSISLRDGWQLDLYNKLQEEPDDRTIFWYWSNLGGVGKSTFVKYMFRLGAAVINKGKYNDMMYQMFVMKKEPRIVLIDIPRMTKTVSYAGLESIKDGMITSSKYECGTKEIDNCHVVVFCNFPPEDCIFSDDRLKIVCLDEDKLWQSVN